MGRRPAEPVRPSVGRPASARRYNSQENRIGGLWALVPVLPAPCTARPERNDRQPPYRGYETGAGNYHARESQTARINIPEVNRGLEYDRQRIFIIARFLIFVELI